MLTFPNRVLLVIAGLMAGVGLLTHTEKALGAAVSNEAVAECSPCVNGNGVHSWVLACCFGTPDCYMYPDATQYNNLGSCPGMHRPCDTVE